MQQFKIIPLSKSYAATIRAKQKDDFGNTLIEQVATGRGPCRISLQPFEPGEDVRLLFSYSPFGIQNAFNQPGPIFIHKKEVETYKDIHQFPPAIKADTKNFPLTLIGYDKLQQMVFTQLVADADIDLLIPQIFDAKPGVLFLHARNAAAGCFICKIERA
jgi:hypothetical protein